MMLLIRFARNIYRRLFKLHLDFRDFIKYTYAKYISKKRIVISLYAREKNFGDDFNRDLLRFFNCVLIYTSDYKKSEAAFTGSILGNYLNDYDGYILGSGFLLKRYNRKENKWNIKFIRGPLSAKQAGIVNKINYADPGILASLIYPEKYKQEYLLGIIPNGREKKEVFQIDFGPDVLKINPHQECRKVIKEIKKCQFIASSSLHGLVFADSFQIPNIHLKFGDKVLGGFHKFKDYYYGMEVMPEYIQYLDSLTTSEIISRCCIRISEQYLSEKQNMVNEIMSKFINDSF